MSTENIFSYVRTQRNDYETRDIPLLPGKNYSQYNTINQVDLYWSNSYMEEASDDVIGDFPFDNISKWRVLLEARATDFDRKNITVEPDGADREKRVKTMISTKALGRQMRKIQFGKTINDICMNRSKYGGVLVTKSEESIDVIPWQNIISDQSNIMAGVRIVRHYLTPSELVAKNDVWENVTSALKTAEKFRDKGVSDISSEEADTQGELIELFEIQGDVKVSMLKEAQAIRDGLDYKHRKKDDYSYVSAKIIIAGADWFDEDKKEERGIVLYANEEKTTQKYLARNPEAGRGLGVGIVEDLFEDQRWHNFTKTEEMRMIAVGGKKLYVTDDPDILGNIFDEGVDHGTVLRVGTGKTLKELNQIPTGTPIYENQRKEINDQADKKTSSYPAKTGEESKSGTPFRSSYLQNFEATSQFEQYREEIGFFLEEIIGDGKDNWVLNDALKNIAKEKELYEAFSPQELMLIDDVIVSKTVTDEMARLTRQRKVLTPEMVEEMRVKTDQDLKRSGTKRSITDIQDFIKDAGGSVVINTTDEQRNKAVYFESLSNALNLLAPEDPRRNAIIDRIMDAIGISKEELEMYNQTGEVPGNEKPELKSKELATTDKLPAPVV